MIQTDWKTMGLIATQYDSTEYTAEGQAYHNEGPVLAGSRLMVAAMLDLICFRDGGPLSGWKLHVTIF